MSDSGAMRCTTENFAKQPRSRSSRSELGAAGFAGADDRRGAEVAEVGEHAGSAGFEVVGPAYKAAPVLP
jgi:hypothetical protein